MYHTHNRAIVFCGALTIVFYVLAVNPLIASGESDIVLKVKGFSMQFGADKEGNIGYKTVEGMAGIGTTGEEAEANLTLIRIGKDPLDKSVLYFQQKQPVKGVRKFYLDATSGISLHSAMKSIFELSALEHRLISCEKLALQELTSFLAHETHLVRQAAVESIARVENKTLLKPLQNSLANEDNVTLKKLMIETVELLEKSKSAEQVSYKVGDYEFLNVSGNLSLLNAKREEITEGPLVLVEGWPARRGKKNEKFKYVKGDTDSIDSQLWELHQPHPETHKSRIIGYTPPAKVKLTTDQYWELLDSNCYFLWDLVAGRAEINFGASFNRSTVFVLDADVELKIGDKTYTSQKTGATVSVRHGHVTSSSDVLVKKFK